MIKNFISSEDCISLIEKSEAMGYEKATVDVGKGVQRRIKGIRNNERVLYKEVAYVTFIRDLLKDFAPEGADNKAAIGLNERHEGTLLNAGVKYVLRTDIMYKQI